MSQKCREWGFDLTNFDSYSDWKAFLGRHGCKLQKTKKLYGDYSKLQFGHVPSHYIWKCAKSIRMTTMHPGKATKKRPAYGGYIGSVGVEFKDRSAWNKMRKDFMSVATIKGESPCDTEFVSTPSVIEKRKAT